MRGELVPRHIRDLHVPSDVADPLGKRVHRQIPPRREPIHSPRRQQLRLRTPHPIDEGPGRVPMARVAHYGNGVHDHRGPALGEYVPQLQAVANVDLDVRQIPNRHEAFLADDLLVEQRSVLDVLLGLRIELPEPAEASRGVARLLHAALDEHPPHGAHRAAGERIPDQHLPFPSR